MPAPGTAACRIALDFLQTVVIVDDQADLDPSGPRASVAPIRSSLVHEPHAEVSVASDEGGELPGATAHGAIEVDAEPTSDLIEPSDDALSVAEHGGLDAKTIINDFAELGLVCGVIRPEEGEDIEPIVSAAARRADVLVLDWWMHGIAGTTSKAIIRQLAESGDQQDRIRLIVIYTAAQDLRNVAAEIARNLDGAEVVGEGLNRIAAGSIRLIVLAKPDTEVDPALVEDVVPFEEFPERIVKEFASTVEGLLSNVAFSALAAIRSSTHKILNRFDRALDPAFLGHRMLLPDPEDAERHLVEMILQEFSAVLTGSAVGRSADYEAIRQLIADAVLVVNDVEKLGEFAARSDTSVPDLVMGFIESGVGYPDFKLSNKEQKNMRVWAPKIFSFASSQLVSTPLEIGKEWSMLMSTKLQYTDLSPALRLGVIVRDTKTRAFMLCMQPMCDSVRLGGRTSFPFLPLEEATDSSDIVIKYSGDYYLLNVKIRFRDVVVIQFEPSNNAAGVVKAVRTPDGKGWQFMPAAAEVASLEWAAELRDNFAYKFANRFAESASRVGTDDSELFRRTGP